MCINAPEGCPHGTHTTRTAYTRDTHSREHTQTQTNTQPTLYHGLRRSRPSPVIAEMSTAVRVHVRRRAVEALRAVVLAHVEPREETLLRPLLLPSVEHVVRLSQPLVVPRAVAEELSLGPDAISTAELRRAPAQPIKLRL